MNKKFAAAVSGGAVLILALSGCGGDDGDKKADAWAKKVCDAWQPELKKIEAANADIKRVSSENNKPEEVQKTDSEAFQTMSDSYKSMGGALSAAGVPPVEDGQATQDAAVKGFEDTSKGYAELKVKVDALDAKDQNKFAEGLKDVANGLAEATKGGEEALAKLKAGGLDKVMNSQKGCQVTVPSPPK
ncbi:small secreted protein [Streptomyces sp. APSN-46.1]|uniref:small secreted protein n=1 Tax=Streptomyces sp. APSN-46.1 TaxID=2929049 RepID=UPI001FB4A48C|nr:small secreted protein [Streptomyces sp. APSN-46.1]MCJ1678261.1 small secreted protein [Streptomyces sp. APSN-46.1]